MLCISSLMLTPPLRCISAITWAILLPARGVLGVLADGVLPSVRLPGSLGGGGLLLRLALGGRAVGRRCAHAGLCGGLRLAARGAGSPLTVRPNLAMRCQILLAARLGSCRRLRGGTPGRLL